MLGQATADFCGICGFPTSDDPRCAACGELHGGGAALRDENKPTLPGEMHPEDYPALHQAFKLWRHKKYQNMIFECLATLGLHEPVTSKVGKRHSWSFNQDSAAIYVLYDTRQHDISIESPMLKLPRTKRVAMMRTLLEMNARVLGMSRFCVRDDTVVLRFVEEAAQLPPPLLLNAISEVAVLADQLDDTIAMTFDARMLGPVARRSNYDVGMLGQPRTLPIVRGQTPRGQRATSTGVFGRIKGMLGGDRPADTLNEEPPADAPWPPVDVSIPDDVLGPPPVPHRPSSSHKTKSADEHEARWSMCEDMRGVLDLGELLTEKHKATPLGHVLLLRATLYTIYGRYADACPKVVWFLMNQGRMLAEHIPPDKPTFLAGGPEAERFMRALYLYRDLDRIVHERGHVDGAPQPPFALTPFGSPGASQRHLMELLRLLDSTARSLTLHVTVLRGAIHELKARAPLSDTQQATLQRFLDESRSSEVTKETMMTLRHRVDRIARG